MSTPDVRALEAWFDDNGLPYLVAGRAHDLEAWLGNRRIVAFLVVLLGVSVAAGVTVAQLSDAGSVGTLVGTTLFAAVAAFYAGGLLRMAVVLRWAVRRTLGSLGLLVPLATRALPLLLLFITFLFVNTEVWQVGSSLPRPSLWAIVLLFAGLATVFLLVRLPDEVRAVAAETHGERLVEACAGTPAEALARRTADDVGDAEAPALPRLARVNLVLVLLFSQALQVLLLTVAVLVFLLCFGSLAIGDGVVESWLGRRPVPLTLFGHVQVPLVSNDLFQVGLFLAAFSGLYFTVYAVTDSTYREQFFSAVARELARAVAVNTVYQAALRR
ncbi:hypothetical protein [Solicola sp. PLA-1-18]|uniref:hypothetical protein n=1 Tax=Solicola sp. PLA-1-18 TaxID=3380532 RepID=UPI003B7A65E5